MPIPDFQSCMLPILKLAADRLEHSLAESRETLAAQFGLSEEERAELLPSGRQRRFDNRVAWAKVYLEQAGLLTSSKRAHFVISDEGLRLLAENPARIDISLLERYPKFQEFRAASRRGANADTDAPTCAETHGATPEETLEQAYQSIRAELASELLTRVQASSPRFFERLVVELLLKMGYPLCQCE